ncbi:MAG: DnaJ C-terminal domain-containing protein [Nitrospinales bacterium]
MKQNLFEFERKAFLLDVEKAVTLDAGAAATGGTIKVRTPSESFRVKIPATTQNPIELLLSEKGGKSFIKGRRGDLLLKIRVVPGGVISPGTTNFFYEMTVPREDIGNGRVLTLNTIQGAIKFFVPRGTRDGQTFVLKAKPAGPPVLQINHVLTLHLV